MKTSHKFITIIIAFAVLILMAGFGAYASKSAVSTTALVSLKGKHLGGVQGRMPENSAKIFFESLAGCKLGGYTAYKSQDACVNALEAGWVDAIWMTDVSAQYVTEVHDNLEIMSNEELADIEKTKEARFEFGLALANTKAGKTLKDSLDEALGYLKDNGSLESLANDYITGATAAEKLTEKDMEINSPAYKKAYKGKKALKVGITGAVPPIELIDGDGKPYGFCVALMDEIGLYLQMPIEFVVLDNETVFTSLLSGRIDAVFCYGTGMITTEGAKQWIMTDGYYPMQRYEFVVRGASVE